MAEQQTPTPEQLREDARIMRKFGGECEPPPRLRNAHARAALALKEQAARLEVPAVELRGWGVMRTDGTLCPWFDKDELLAGRRATRAEGYRAVPVRLIADSATAQDL